MQFPSRPATIAAAAANENHRSGEDEGQNSLLQPSSEMLVAVQSPDYCFHN